MNDLSNVFKKFIVEQMIQKNYDYFDMNNELNKLMWFGFLTFQIFYLNKYF